MRALIELTDHCTMECLMCCNRKSPHGIEKGFMDIELFKNILSQLANKKEPISLELFWLGESMLHPDFEKIIKFAGEKIKQTPHTLNLHTNGALLDKYAAPLLDLKDKLPYLTISLDAITQETHARIRRNGDLKKITQNIKYFLEERKKRNQLWPKIGFQFIIMPENVLEIVEFVNYWTDYFREYNSSGLFSDYIFLKRLEVHNLEKQKKMNALFDEIIEKNNLYSRKTSFIELISKDHEVSEKTVNKPYWFEENNRKPCAALWKMPCIRWDGELTVCCFDDIFLLSIGNLNNETFDTFWNGEKINQMRQSHIEGKFSKVQAKDGYKKCEKCIGLYHPTITEEEITRWGNSL